jgi:C4-dicarboxylate-specific signal transduction histidine kinase
VVNQHLGFLYSENGPEPEKLDEITPKLKDDSFAVNFGTGKSKDGVSIPLEVARYNRINDGGAVLLLRDITERRQVEEKLEDYRCHLEDLVKQRTAALERANQELQREVREREQTATTFAGAKCG